MSYYPPTANQIDKEIRGNLDYRTYHWGSRHPYEQFPKKYQEKKPHISELNFDIDIQQKISTWGHGANNFLVFLGRAGAGKTHFCAALAAYVWEVCAEKTVRDVFRLEEVKNSKGTVLSTHSTDDKIGVRIDLVHPEIWYFNIAEIYEECKKLYSAKKLDCSFKESLQKVKYLIIDDLGATANTAWQVQIVYEILDYRYSNCHPTIITSNLNFDQIEIVFHQRIRSRLEDSGNNVLFDWETDWRTKGL